MTDNKLNKAKKQGQVISITSKKILVNDVENVNLNLDVKKSIESYSKEKPLEKQQQSDKNGGCSKNLDQRVNSKVFKQSRVSLPITNDAQSKLLQNEDHLEQQQSNNNSKHNKQFELKIGTAHSRNDAIGIVKYLSNPTSGTTRNNHGEQNSAFIKPIYTTNASHLSSQSTSLSQSAFIGMRKTSQQQKFQKNHIKQMVIKIQQAEGQMSGEQLEMIKKNQATKALANPPFSVKNVVLSQMKSNYATRAPKVEVNSVDRLDDALKKALGNQPKKAPIDIAQGSDFKPLSSQQIDKQLVQMTPSHSNHSKHFRFSTETSTQVEKSFNMIKPYSYHASSKRDSSNNFLKGARLDPTQSPLSKSTTGNKFLLTRPISNLGAHHAGLFHMARTSLPNILTSHISPITLQQEPKRLTPSEPSSDLENDNDDDTLQQDQDECCYHSSALDTFTTGSLVEEGPTASRIPKSQIKPTKKVIINKSEKTTERYQKPFVRPQNNGELVISKRKESKMRQFQKKEQNGKNDNMRMTRKKSKSHSNSADSDVEAEYFQAGSNLRLSTQKIKVEWSPLREEASTNLLPLLEGFCKRGDIVGLSTFLSTERHLIKQVSEFARALMYKSIEFHQSDMLKYLLTEFLEITNLTSTNYNLLHIVCRPKKGDFKELSLVKVVMSYDAHADLNSQDTYGNTPVHLAAQQGKQDVLSYFLTEFNPILSIRNSEGNTALHFAKNTAIIQIFMNYFSKLRQESLKNKSLQSELKKLEAILTNDEEVRILFAQNQSKKPDNMNRDRSVSYCKKIIRQPDQQKSQRTASERSESETKIRVPTSENIHDIGNISTKKIKNDHYLVRAKALIQPDQKHQQNYSRNVCQTEPSQDLSKSQNLSQNIQLLSDRSNPINQELILDTELVINEDDTLQYCEQIEEVSDESLQNSIIQPLKIGPQSFEPISLIGQGSFGEVYLVKMKDGSEKLYAMKVLQKSKIMGQNLVKYAVTERNVLSITRHPFIVGLNFAFQTKEKLFLILDYCPGGDLGKVLMKEKRFNEDRARLYLAEVLLALEDLHQRDIIFRDLKPDNVVLDKDGHALLTDFGLSKEGVLDNLGAKSFCGSVAYLAPEMLKRTGHGKSVDWYLLGVLLYEMLVGIPPYFTNNKEKLFQNIQRGPLLIPSQLSKEAKGLIIGVINQYAQFIKQLLSKNPLKRLGAGQRDSAEIKEHGFFQGIDWTQVRERKLKMPKPSPIFIKPLQQQEIESYQQIIKNEINSAEKKEQILDANNLPGWSFVTPVKQ